MTKLQKALAELFLHGRSIALIVKAVGVDPSEVEMAIRLKLQGVK